MKDWSLLDRENEIFTMIRDMENTVNFLSRKVGEIALAKKEIAELKKDVEYLKRRGLYH